MIERAGMQPHATRADGPGVLHGVREQVLSEAATELRGNDAEVRDLDRIILGDTAQLVPACQLDILLLFFASGTRRDKELNGWVSEVIGDLLVGPIPAVEPMKRLADGFITHPIELGL